MKKTDWFLLSLFTIILLSSCQSDKNKGQFHHFEADIWNRFNILSFDLGVNSIKQSFSILAIVRFTEDYPYDNIPVHLIMTSPAGEERIWEQTLVLRKGGKPFGKHEKNYFEIVIPIRTKHRFMEKGKHKITVEQIIPKYDTYGIISFGIQLVND